MTINGLKYGVQEMIQILNFPFVKPVTGKFGGNGRTTCTDSRDAFGVLEKALYMLMYKIYKDNSTII